MKRCASFVLISILAVMVSAACILPQIMPGLRQNRPSATAPDPTLKPLSTKAPRPTPTPTPVPTSALADSATPLPTDPAAASVVPKACANGDCITTCFNKLPVIANPGDKNKKHTSHAVANPDGYVLETYTISGDQIVNPVEGSDFPAWLKPYQQDRTSQQKIWNYFAAIIPAQQRSLLTEFTIFSDGENNNLASVAQSSGDMNKWGLQVDIVDSANPQDLTSTLIHEFGHLLTLNPSQVVPSKRIFDNPNSDTIYEEEVSACPTYFPGEGCSKPNSYINQFYKRFWTGIEQEWSDIDAIVNEDDYNAALNEFYTKYQDQFVSDYAPTNPSEDMAESFMDFILNPKPTGKSIANQKVLFFYGFPEFVQLRTQIAGRLCAQITH